MASSAAQAAALQALAVVYHVPEERALRLRATQVGEQLGGGQQACQRVSVSLAGPFAEMPWLRLQYRLPDGAPRRIQTRLPVVFTKFMAGHSLSPKEFFRHWRSAEFARSEAACACPIPLASGPTCASILRSSAPMSAAVPR